MTDPVNDHPGNGSTVPVLLPEGKEMLDLTMRELDIVSRKVQADVSAILGAKSTSPLKYQAMALVAWLWAKRADQSAKYDTYFDYDIDDLSHALRMDVPNVPAEVEDPTSPAVEPSASD